MKSVMFSAHCLVHVRISIVIVKYRKSAMKIDAIEHGHESCGTSRI